MLNISELDVACDGFLGIVLTWSCDIVSCFGTPAMYEDCAAIDAHRELAFAYKTADAWDATRLTKKMC